MSGKKRTPRTLITSFLRSDEPEQTPLQPETRLDSQPGGVRRRSSRVASVPSELNSGNRRTRVSDERKSLHHSLMEDNTPRHMLMDYLQHTQTVAPMRKRSPMERTPDTEPVRKSPRLNTSAPDPMRREFSSSSRVSSIPPVPASPPRRRSWRRSASLHNQTVLRNFVMHSSPTSKPAAGRSKVTPRTMMDDFLMGDTPAQTPMPPLHTPQDPSPAASHSLHSSSSTIPGLDPNQSISEESLLKWQQEGPHARSLRKKDAGSRLSRAPQAPGAQFSFHASPSESESLSPVSTKPPRPTSGARNDSAISSGNDSVVSRPAEGDGSYLSMPSSQYSQRLSQKSTGGRHVVDKITSDMISQRITDFLDKTTGEGDGSHRAGMLDSIREDSENVFDEESPRSAGKANAGDQSVRSAMGKLSMNVPAEEERDDLEGEEVVPPSDNENSDYEDEELPSEVSRREETPRTESAATPDSAATTPGLMEGYAWPRIPGGDTRLADPGELRISDRNLTTAFPTPVPMPQSVPGPSGRDGTVGRGRGSRPPRNPNASLRIPTVNTRSIAAHFCSINVSKDAVHEIEKVADKFWERVPEDLMTFAKHAGRKNTPTEEDVELLMRRQGFVTDKMSMHSLVVKYLSLEQQEEIIPCLRKGGKIYPRK